MKRLKVEAIGLTHPGLVRPHNEDSWGELPTHKFYVLADGMGGHQAGEVAAKKAVEGLCNEMEPVFANPARKDLSVREFAEELFEAIVQVNRQIFDLGCSDENLHGMGTTLCSLFVHPEGVVYAHVGDSRIYRMRQGRLSLLTRDHSLLSEMLDLGQIEEHQASDFVYRNIITKAIGTDPLVTPSVEVDSIEDGDLFLLCSDGLSDLLTKNEMEELIASEKSIDRTGHLLVKSANEKGGTDNVTVVLVQVSLNEE